MDFGRTEDSILNNIDRNRGRENTPLMKEAYLKAEKVFAQEWVEPKDFAELYGEESIERDAKTVQGLKNRFEIDKNQIPAKVLEAIVLEQSELSEWFGPHASTVLTAEFDDIVNGVDMVVEFNEPEQNSAIWRSAST